MKEEKSCCGHADFAQDCTKYDAQLRRMYRGAERVQWVFHKNVEMDSVFDGREGIQARKKVEELRRRNHAVGGVEQRAKCVALGMKQQHALKWIRGARAKQNSAKGKGAGARRAEVLTSVTRFVVMRCSCRSCGH